VNKSWPSVVNDLRVIPALRFFILLLTPLAGAMGATTQISGNRPIINFSLPHFTPEGYRAWLVRGSEARYLNPNHIAVQELTLSIFSGQADEKVQTMILSPRAAIQPTEAVITGPQTIRVINDEFEATGSDWRYAYKEHQVTIAQNVRVIFHAEFKEILK